MRFETKYNIGDKVWVRIEDIESYIKAHPYTEPAKILESCFREAYVNAIKIETDILTHEYWVTYIIYDKLINKDDDLEDIALRQYNNILNYREENIFSNFDEVTNMIKETHKFILNSLKYIADHILKKYE